MWPFKKSEELLEVKKIFEEKIIGIEDIIAPSAVEINPNYLRMGERMAKTFFVFTFPRYLSTAWFSPVVNLDSPLDISLYVYPIETAIVLRKLRKKIAEVQAEISEREEKGLVRAPELEIAFKDLEDLRDKLHTAQEKMFRFGVYITTYGSSERELKDIESSLRSILEARLIYLRPTTFRQKEGFISTSPYFLDQIQVNIPMNTAPLSSVFPFISFDLSANEGILYGINSHNNSLVLFDRFSLENSNMVLFGKAGGGKTIRGCEKVLVRDNNGIQLVKIGSLTEKFIKKQGTVKIDEEIEGVIDPEVEVYSFNKKLKGEWSKVTVAMRKKAPKLYYKIRTRSGREITTTGDHNMVILRKGKVITAKSSEIKEGEYAPLPREIGDIRQKSPEYLKKIKGVNNFPINNEFLKLAGFITAEGTITDSYIEISNTDLEVLKAITSSLKKLKISFFEIKDKNKQRINAVRTCQKAFFKKVKILGGGGKSKQKKVWPFIFNLEKGEIAQYLSAYFEGDGGIEDNKAITATSKSKRLISEITYLLYYFGIIARISNGNWKRKRSYYKLTISGQNNLRKFAENINFISKRKRRLLSRVVRAEGNTNVDLIPGLEPIFKEISGLFSPQLSEIPEISEWKRGKRTPSPQHLEKVIGKIEERIRRFKDLASTFKVLSELPELATIIDLGENNKELNRALWKTLGQNWGVVKNKGVKPGSINMFKALGILNGSSCHLPEVKSIIHQGFQEMGLPIKYFNLSLQPALTRRLNSNTDYQMIQGAAQFVWQNYQEILTKNIPQIEEKLVQLKILANSDLFWDPIVKIEKIKNKKEKYVYDLTVDNEVFLAGEGGMFVHNSYAVKLEILRSLMQGIDVIVIDPENEYQFLSEAVGGSHFKISLTSPNHLNPFDLPPPREDESPGDVLRSNVINLVGLLRIMLGGLTPEEDAIMDQALIETYAARDITPESDFTKITPPLLSDLEEVLRGMEGAGSLAVRLRKFTSGSYAGFLNQFSNVDMGNKFVAFGIRDMEEELRPMALYIILKYIWNTIRAELKKRILIIDEAWWLMRTEDGASFLFGTAKRARKYWLGVTTITQDVIDFLKSDYGQPIINNSSVQLLMKQSPSSIELLAKTFNLTDEEKYLLVEGPVGEGLFFAGPKHVAMRVVASYTEDQIITTAPEEVVKIKKAKKELK